MKKTTNPTTELCAVCGGALRPTTITHEERRKGHLYLFENVPEKWRAQQPKLLKKSWPSIESQLICS